MRGEIDAMVLLEAAEDTEEPVLPVTRDRLCLSAPMGFELATRDLRPLPSPATTQHRSREHDRLKVNLRVNARALIGLLYIA
jgi:hypothetical protein